MKIKKIEPLSCGKMLGGVYAFIGLVLGGLMALLSLMGASFGGREAGAFAFVFGIGGIIIFPIFYFVVGLILGLLGAIFYNIIANFMGGIEITVE